MNLGKAFTYPFEDKAWTTKVGLGIVITLVPILNFATAGYLIEIMRRLLRGDPEPLPDWTDLGRKFMDGLMVFLAGLVYFLPVLIVLSVPAGLMLIPAVLAGNTNTQNIGQILSTAGGVALACLGCLAILYGVALSIIFPCAYLQYARQGRFGTFFQLQEFFALIGKDAGAFFTAWGIYLATSIGATLVAGAVGGLFGLIPCVGQLVAFVIGLGVGLYVALVFAHLFGQFGLAVSRQAPTA
ncbi:MAG: DUF4013 domain-containing protein [Anaerolineales bacterium]|jgi:hypothetical protein